MPKSKSPITKAGKVKTDSNPYSTFDIISGKSVENNYSSKQLIQLNGNYATICNIKNANTLASIPLKLFYVSDKEITRTPYKSITFEKQEEIAKSLKINIKGQNIVEIIDHPVLDLLQKVKPGWNGFDLRSVIAQYLGSIGNSYVEIIEEDGVPIELHPLLAENVTIKASSGIDGVVTGYEYCLDKKVINYKPEQIIHFLNYMPGNNMIGRGELELC